ncbi:mechanosensitive ion channel [Coraliomargarita sp. W4R53]
MNTFLNSLTDKLGEYLPGVIPVLIILVAGLFLAKAIKTCSVKIFAKLKLNSKLSRGGEVVKYEELFASIIYYVCVLFVLVFVLERMGISSALDPLKNMLNDFVGYIPNMIAAGIVFYAGWVIAKVVSSLVEVSCAKVDAVCEAKGVDFNFKISKFLSAFVFGGILIPIYIAGFEILEIAAISDPAISMLSSLANAVPNIVGAAIILLIAYMIGKLVIFLLSGLLDGMNANSIPEKMGFANLFGKFTFIQFVTTVLMFFIMLSATTMAVEVLKIKIISTVFAQVLSFGGNIVVGIAILAVGNFLATIAHKKMSENSDNTFMAVGCTP